MSDTGYSLERDAQSLCRRYWSRHFNPIKAKMAAAQINSGVRLIDTNAPLVAVKVTFQKAPVPGSQISAGLFQWLNMRGLTKCQP